MYIANYDTLPLSLFAHEMEQLLFPLVGSILIPYYIRDCGNYAENSFVLFFSSVMTKKGRPHLAVINLSRIHVK